MRAEDVAKQHIRRVQLPWRDDPGLTECGLDAAKFETVNYDDFADKLKEQGQARASLSTCMTCWQTMDRYRGYWSAGKRDFRTPSLIQVLDRELSRHVSHWSHREESAGRRLRHELEAMVQMVAMDRLTFEGIIAELEATVEIKDIVRKPKTATKRARWE